MVTTTCKIKKKKKEGKIKKEACLFVEWRRLKKQKNQKEFWREAWNIDGVSRKKTKEKMWEW